MSREAINKLFTRAMLDPPFAHRLLADPLQAAMHAGFELTLEERNVFSRARANTISELSEIILVQLSSETPE